MEYALFLTLFVLPQTILNQHDVGCLSATVFTRFAERFEWDLGVLMTGCI